MLGLLVATLLARVTLEYGGRIGRFLSRAFAAGFILPFAIPGVVAAVVWKMFLDPQIGPLDALIGSPIAWFAHYPLTAIIIIDAWKTMPFVMFLLYAGIMSIEPQQFEAAKLDGASRWQEFWHLTLPGILPVIASHRRVPGRRCIHQGLRHHPRHDRRRSGSGDDGVSALHLAHRVHQPPLRRGFGTGRHRDPHFRPHRREPAGHESKGPPLMAAGALRRNPNGSVAVLAFITLITLLPIVWMVLSAFKPDHEINQIPPTFLPQRILAGEFHAAFHAVQFRPADGQFHRRVRRSRYPQPGSRRLGGIRILALPVPRSRLILGAILVTRMVTPASLVLPLYVMMEALHLSNTLFAVTVGITVLNLPFAYGC